jgi:hypothetical protein
MRWLVVILVCSLGAAALATLIAPRMLSWYASPPVPIGVSCDPAITWGMSKLILSQTIGLGVGALIGSFFAYKICRRPKPANPTP